jgi:hypothetical protein
MQKAGKERGDGEAMSSAFAQNLYFTKKNCRKASYCLTFAYHLHLHCVGVGVVCAAIWSFSMGPFIFLSISNDVWCRYPEQRCNLQAFNDWDMILLRITGRGSLSLLYFSFFFFGMRFLSFIDSLKRAFFSSFFSFFNSSNSI